MKILYHHRTQAEDGQAVHIRSLQRAFREEGHELREVGLVSQGASAEGATRGRGRWGWITRLPPFARELAEYAYSVPARARLSRELRAFAPDFVYERYAFGNAGGVLAARQAKVPLVLEVNSPLVLELELTRGLSFPRTARRLERWILREAPLVCAVTSVLRTMLIEIGARPESVIVTPNGVELELYEYPEREALRRAARSDLGVPQGCGMLLGFVGYYRSWHRLELAVAALARPLLREAHLVLIGEGPAHADLLAAARQHGVLERVHFAGRRAHAAIPALLPAFDVALLPAINAYASPLKLHEYMAASLPTVAPDQPNLAELLVSEQNALLFDPLDPASMANSIERLGADPDLCRRLGAAARQTVVQRELTWRGNARRVVDAVRSLR